MVRIPEQTGTYVVYKLTFNDDSVYIGQTCNLDDRIRKHKRGWLARFGLTIAVVDILHTTITQTEALKLEIEFIKAHANSDVGLRNTVHNAGKTDKTSLLANKWTPKPVTRRAKRYKLGEANRLAAEVADVVARRAQEAKRGSKKQLTDFKLRWDWLMNNLYAT